MAEEKDNDDIVRVATAANAQEAHIWRQALEAEGIRCRVVGDFLQTGAFANLPAATAEVWVYQEDLERARAILARHTELAPPEEP
jgi:hypothetical protein